MSWEQFLVGHLWKLAVLAVLLACSGFFSGTETALFNLTRGQLFRLGRSRHKLGRLVASLMMRPQRVLNVLLLGNMLVNVAFAGIAAVVVLDLKRLGVPGYAMALASLAPLVALILFGEVLPKVLAYGMCERWAVAAALPLSLVSPVLVPPLWVLEKGVVTPLTRILAPRRAATPNITAEELEALLDLSAKRGTIDRDAGELIQEIVHLTDRRVSDIMVPRVDMIAYDVDDSAEGLAELFRKTHLRKIPVYEKDLDHILGVVHAKRLFLDGRRPLRDLVRDLIFVPEAGNLERLLVQFRKTHRQMAIVLDEYGGTAGLVTLEDLLEEIVGDIPDVHDVKAGPTVQRLGEREYLLDGDLSIHEWHEAFGMDLSQQRISTVGGFVTSLLGRIPQVADAAAYRNLRFTVQTMRRRRVGTLRLELLEASG